MAKKPASGASSDLVQAEPRETTLSFPLPEALHHALKLRALQERTTVRAIVLQGLRSLGFEVPEEEMMDRRVGRAGRPKGT